MSPKVYKDWHLSFVGHGVEILYLFLFSHVQLISIVLYVKVLLLFHFVYRCSLITSLLGYSLRCSVLLILFAFAHIMVSTTSWLWVTSLVSCKRQELFTAYLSRVPDFTPDFGGVRVTHLFSFLRCVLLCLSSSCVLCT